LTALKIEKDRIERENEFISQDLIKFKELFSKEQFSNQKIEKVIFNSTLQFFDY
jgi:hypothetical protein